LQNTLHYNNIILTEDTIEKKKDEKSQIRGNYCLIITVDIINNIKKESNMKRFSSDSRNYTNKIKQSKVSLCNLFTIFTV